MNIIRQALTTDAVKPASAVYAVSASTIAISAGMLLFFLLNLHRNE